MFGKSIPLIAIVLVGLLTVGASAALLTYYNSIGGLVHVKQAVLVDGEGIGTPIVEEFGSVTGGDIVCTIHTLENMATIPAPVNFGTDFDPQQDGIIVKYLDPIEYTLVVTAGGIQNDPVDIDVTDDGTSITWTIDFPGEAPYDDPTTEGNGLRAVGLVIALDGNGEGPAFQIHNNDGTDSSFEWGTWLYSPWGPTINDGWFGWHSGDTNTEVSTLNWISCTGGRYNEDNPDGIFTISIDKAELGLCATDFHWALNLAIGSGFYNEYMTYEQMAYPMATPGPSFNWATPLVDDIVDNYEYATIANEITGVTLAPGELFDFVICYTFPINVAGDYTITTMVNVD